MSSSPHTTSKTPDKESKEAARRTKASSPKRTVDSPFDALLHSLRPLAERDPERHKRLSALRLAERAFRDCADRELVCPWEPKRPTLNKKQARVLAAGRAKRWLELWVVAAKALRTVQIVGPADILDVPRGDRSPRAPETMKRVAAVKSVFLDLVRGADESTRRIERRLAELFVLDPDSFEALGWYFGAVAFELHVIANELQLTDDERRSRDDFLGAGGAEGADRTEPTVQSPGKCCGGDSRYPETEWMLLPKAARATGWSESTVRRRIKKLPTDDHGETDPKPRLVVRIAALRMLVEREGRPWNGP